MLKCDHMKWTSTRAKVDMGEGVNVPEFCGHLLWMAPNTVSSPCFDDVGLTHFTVS